MLASFGPFIFMLQSLPFQTQARSTEWRHPNQDVLGTRPTRQFVGVGPETLDISGVLFPEITGGTLSIELLRQLCDEGKPYPFIQGTGEVLGMYVCTKLTDTRTFLQKNGRALKIEFSFNLSRISSENIDKVAKVSQIVMGSF